jgi:hypothetical protein
MQWLKDRWSEKSTRAAVYTGMLQVVGALFPEGKMVFDIINGGLLAHAAVTKG